MDIQALFMFVLSLFSGSVGWYITNTMKQINDTQIRLNDRMNAVETRVTVLETKQDVHYYKPQPNGGVALQHV